MMISLDVKLMTHFLLVSFLFPWPLGSHPISSARRCLGWLCLLQLEGLAAAPGSGEPITPETNICSYSLQAPFCSSLHRNPLYPQWQPSNHHAEVWGKFRSTNIYWTGAPPGSPAPSAGKWGDGAREMVPPLKELFLLTKDQEASRREHMWTCCLLAMPSPLLAKMNKWYFRIITFY